MKSLLSSSEINRPRRPVSMFLIRTGQDWVGKLLDRPSPQDEEVSTPSPQGEEVSTPSPQGEEVSTPSPQSGAYMIEERRVHTTALRLDWYRLLILFLPVYLCTCVLIFKFQKDCHTEKYPGGEYNNQTETWTERQEIEVCTDTEWLGAILAGVALFMVTLLCFVFICLPVLGWVYRVGKNILLCCGCINGEYV